MTEAIDMLGRYTILDELGRGGFATVYRALDTTLDREVALKVLDPLLLRDATWVARFQQEARTVAALEHPHIITIYEINEVERRLYLAMVLASGGNLAQRIAAQGRLSWVETLRLLQPVCAALDYAHRHGVVHRDLKPQNILLDAESGPQITDFGFARMLSDNSMSLSMSGGILGTPAYVAPEVWELDAAAGAADIYALGCIVYEMLTGQTLFSSATPMQAVRAHAMGPRYGADWPDDVPAGIEDVLDKALEQEPGQRYPTATMLWHGLHNLEAAADVAQETVRRSGLAAQWQAETEAAIAAGEWPVAKMMVGCWLAVAPDSSAAQKAQTRIAAALDRATRTGFDTGAEEQAVPADAPKPHTGVGQHYVQHRQPERSATAQPQVRDPGSRVGVAWWQWVGTVAGGYALGYAGFALLEALSTTATGFFVALLMLSPGALVAAVGQRVLFRRILPDSGSWLLVSGVAGTIGAIIQVTPLSLQLVGWNSLHIWVPFAISGLTMGLAQWVWLRRRFGCSGGWILATGAGAGIAAEVCLFANVLLSYGVGLSHGLGGFLSELFLWTVVGMGVGTGQWLVLRQCLRKVPIPESQGTSGTRGMTEA